MPEPTIRDVAAWAGVSVATVSRVLNGGTRVAPATRIRIEAAIRALGYAPNRVARSLVQRRTAAIGVLVPDIANPFFAEVARGLGDGVAAHRFHLILANVRLDPQKELEYLDLFRELQVEGVIYTSGPVTGPLREALLRLRRPVMLAATKDPEDAIPAVLVDSRRGAALAMDHLLGLGHRQIAILGGPRQDPIAGRPRWDGYLAAARAAGVEIPPQWQLVGDFRLESGYRLAAQLLQHSRRPTAVCAASDLMAVGAMNAALDHGLRVPEDFSVVGFDNIALCEAVRPRLTTVAQPLYHLGLRAASALIGLIGGTAPEPVVEWVAPAVVARGSTGPGPAVGRGA